MFAEEFHTNGNSSIEQIREEIWIKNATHMWEELN